VFSCVEGSDGGRHRGSVGKAIKRNCGIHEDLETLLSAKNSRWPKSTTPGRKQYSRCGWSTTFLCTPQFNTRFSMLSLKPDAGCYLKEGFHPLHRHSSDGCTADAILVLPPGQRPNL